MKCFNCGAPCMGADCRECQGMLCATCCAGMNGGKPAPAGQAAPPTTVEAAFLTYLEEGDHPEVRAFEARLGTTSGLAQVAAALGHPKNVWEFIRDAVDGTGGFASGNYLYPFRMELQLQNPGQAVGLAGIHEKYYERKLQADYDGFAGDICNAPLDLIASKADLIKRQISDKRGAAWVQDVDGLGTPLGLFLEAPAREARRYGVAWVFEDRPAVTPRNLVEDLAPENRPYPYLVPTQNVRWWKFDEKGAPVALAVCEPDPDGPDCQPCDCPTRVWTPQGWALYAPIDQADHRKRDGWRVMATAVLELGRIPVVRVANDRPSRGCSGLGQTGMLKVARLAQVHYNMESEAREIERKASCPVLTIPVKNSAEYAKDPIVIGTESALTYDGEAGAPAFIQPDLAVLESYEKRKAAKVAAAYKMENLDALAGSAGKDGGGGSVQGSSGFHLEVAFSKTERRISRFAANLENAEADLVALCLQWYGMTAEDARKAVEIAYPREFGIRDLDRLLDRTTKELDTLQGEAAQREVLEGYFRARFPRKTPDEIQALVDGEIRKRASMRAQLQAATSKAQEAIDATRNTAMARSVVKGT